jgi:hypothetical protein
MRRVRFPSSARRTIDASKVGPIGSSHTMPYDSYSAAPWGNRADRLWDKGHAIPCSFSTKPGGSAAAMGDGLLLD